MEQTELDSGISPTANVIHNPNQIMSAAWRSGLERRFYDSHDRKVNGSTPN